jgi:hypothetical protein
MLTIRTGQTLQAIDVDEVDVLTFEFAPGLDEGESIATVAVQCTVHSGTDASPQDLLVGLPQISGTDVLQQVQGNVSGVTYHLRCLATLNSGRVLVAAGYLPCVTL